MPKRWKVPRLCSFKNQAQQSQFGCSTSAPRNTHCAKLQTWRKASRARSLSAIAGVYPLPKDFSSA